VLQQKILMRRDRFLVEPLNAVARQKAVKDHRSPRAFGF
jgi:hypothetical protein